MEIDARRPGDRPIAGGSPMPDETGRRIVLDISTIARWSGPAVGIVRVEHAYASYARAYRPDAILAVYDPSVSSYREVLPRWAESLVDWNGSLDKATFDFRRHWHWLRKLRSPRYPIFIALERRRLTSRSPGIRHTIDAIQRVLWLRPRLPPPFTDKQGRRRQIIPEDFALGAPLSLGPRDTVATAGFDWFNQDPNAIARMKKERGFRFVAMCFDIIPLQFPEFYTEHDVAGFQRYWDAMFPLADKILAISRRVEADIKEYCASRGIKLAETQVVPLGVDPALETPGATLPDGLKAGCYALLVGTIEPRKGHAMLLRLWQRLLADGIPQSRDFKLVFAGRRGWQVGALLRQIDSLAKSSGSIMHLEEAGDSELSALYAGSAFCVYPSRYEGFGLPVIEAFSWGKAVIASTGGALPDTVGGLSPCLDPENEDDWYRVLKGWIEDPSLRAPYEAKIRASFSHPDWREAAARFFEAIDDCHADRTSVVVR